MSSLQHSGLVFSSSTFSSSRISAAISVPKLPRIRFPVPKAPSRNLVEEFSFTHTIPTEKTFTTPRIIDEPSTSSANSSKATAQLYAILEAVADRVEMHKNIGEQRDNWNNLLLNSINMITLTAATMTGVAATGGAGVPLLALKLSSTLLFSAATGISLIMNKIQPSQLAEEQRNATRLFRQLYSQLQTTLALHDPTEMDVRNAMENVLALDKAYPLPLLGKMIEKFPAKFEPAVWWPKSKLLGRKSTRHRKTGWSEELEVEMREVIELIKGKDREDYMRLGNLALKINKILAISGPLLTGIAAAGSAFVGNNSWAAIVAVAAGALASTVNTFEHAGQVGMVVEMYRNCAGSFSLLEESIQSALEEKDLESREDGEIFEMRVALKLGRSLSELRDVAKKSSSSRIDGADIDEFASKLM
ncbi:probable F-box protein At4g22030 [Ricinus communis]|uniref:F-box protein n=1 Tax=Ricinus communis TaxID=3988 RepID=B9RXI5_RICCO|nr:probable F-box protein At4g22030 [Ricinus communis]EEF43841.1 conserved hypothetical protein [Ricinus communis]|eukprot:XP_002518454.1 probable F-box protein At4g22030 [Ricinus communis]